MSVGPSQVERRANANYVIFEFAEPVGDETLDAIKKAAGPILVNGYVAYDNGFGHLVPKENT